MKRVMVAALVALAGCTTTDRVQLTPAEVQSTFIGKTWRGPSGRFLFSRNGQYQYWSNSGDVTPRLNYQMLPDGTLRGATTSYTFYRTPDGKYLYRHSRTGKVVPAFVN